MMKLKGKIQTDLLVFLTVVLITTMCANKARISYCGESTTMSHGGKRGTGVRLPRSRGGRLTLLLEEDAVIWAGEWGLYKTTVFVGKSNI